MTESLMANLFVFVLATFIGLEVIRRVSPLLHTPLMSLTNAISGISLVGSMVILGEQKDTLSTVLGALAVVASTINIVSGFLITDRMLRMFKKREPAKAAHVITFPAMLLAVATSGNFLTPVATLTQISFLVGSALFILSLKWMSAPTTARNGVIAGEIGMVLAVVGTLLMPEIVAYQGIVICLVIGAAIGTPIAMLMPMTAAPQRTALSHAFGGLSVGLVGTAKFFLWGSLEPERLSGFTTGIIAFEILLGLITFTGSLMAFGKLQEILPTRPITYKGQNVVNGILFAIAIAAAVMLTINPLGASAATLFLIIAGLSLVFGVLLIIPIGGADMPTVISLLNSYAGLSACAMGFVLDNKLLILAGALDGSSGLILSIIMCKAMNRSFTNVLFGAFGQVTASALKGEQKSVRSAGAEEAAQILESAQTVVIIPGYGMAVAQAQHKVRELY
ncbi:MAG: NAD(P)(+) transhydrogenase (Re/Si-specific) subunit beta, partial [Fimbriimonas sp.]